MKIQFNEPAAAKNMINDDIFQTWNSGMHHHTTLRIGPQPILENHKVDDFSTIVENIAKSAEIVEIVENPVT